MGWKTAVCEVNQPVFPRNSGDLDTPKAPSGGEGWGCHRSRAAVGSGVVERPRRGDEIEVTVDDLAYGGRGVARADGFVVFTPDTAPGDRATVRLRKVRRR